MIVNLIQRAYFHRNNPDGTYDSICLGCFLTVATATNEELLEESEAVHRCLVESDWEYRSA